MRNAKRTIFRAKANDVEVNSEGGCAELSVRHSPQTPESLPRSNAEEWEAIFQQLDQAGVPDDFLNDRAQDFPQDRPEL